MKQRTEILLAAGEHRQLHDYTYGACGATRAAARDRNLEDREDDVEWFNKWFAPPEGVDGIDGFGSWWLGEKCKRNLGRRMTFLAMAAAVSETEE